MNSLEAIKRAVWSLFVVAIIALGLSFSTVSAARAEIPDVVVVAVLDTGIDVNHAALKGKVVAGVNLSGSKTETDVHGHGTHIAGIIASNADNVRILDVKVADDNGITDCERVSKGIVWSVENGAMIINISIALRETDENLEKAVTVALDRGVIVVAAAGNDGAAVPSYPAACRGVVSVGATDSQRNIAPWSNGGASVSAVAPGVGIVSALPGGRWGVKSGTSQAAARVTAEFVSRLAGPRTVQKS